jgi:outer membrane immunogenic protein
MRYVVVALVGATALSVASVSLASAADLPTKAPIYKAPAMAAYNWTGFYVGGQIGGGWRSEQATVVTGTGAFPPGYVGNTVNESGVLGGGYAGFNYQINQFVVGIDGDYSWAGLNGSTTETGPTGFTSNIMSKEKWVATLTGRLGYAMNNWLFFGKAGWAWAGVSGTTATYNSAGANFGNGTSSSTTNGWTIGTGVEWGFARNWSAKLEYDYVKFNTDTYTLTDTSVLPVPGVVTAYTRSATSSENIVKLGLAYRF